MTVQQAIKIRELLQVQHPFIKQNHCYSTNTSPQTIRFSADLGRNWNVCSKFEENRRIKENSKDDDFVENLAKTVDLPNILAKTVNRKKFRDKAHFETEAQNKCVISTG